MPETSSELSEREQEILRLVATGASNKEIARQLYISANTVKVHLRNIYAKLGAASRTEAAMYAVNNGLVPAVMGVPVVADEGSRDAVETAIALPPLAEPGRKKFPLWLVLATGVLLLLLVLAIAWPRLFRPQSLAIPTSVTDIPRWLELAPMPAARTGFAAAVYENQIFTFAGATTQGVTGLVARYDPVQNSWLAAAEKPTPVEDVSAVVIGGKIFMPGGKLANGKATDILEIYDPRTDSWQTGAPLPVKVFGYALAAFEGRLYLFGGWQDDVTTALALEYDPIQDQWDVLPQMTSARGYAGAGVAGRKIYIFGGSDGKTALKSTEVFQPDLLKTPTGPWSKAADLPEGIYGMGAASLADIIYLVGGEGSAEEREFSNLAYFPQNDNWQSFEVSPKPIGAHPSLVNLGTFLYVLGGRVDGEPTAANLSYRAMFTVSIPVIIK